MAAIDDLIAKIQDADLRERITSELQRALKRRQFGLVFEEHLPETSLMYDVPVRCGLKVQLRRQTQDDKGKTWVVSSVKEGVAACYGLDGEGPDMIPVSDLVVVVGFGEAIYPYLKPLDFVCNAPDSDLWHTLIEADNYHALQLLEYLYAEKVDCIYIDPPYNTGARDWKYNNDYVDGTDSYRHSKWLSFMQRRLLLAKKLLNPKDSVLIVTIDEKEYLHLGCLLEQMFPEGNIQMISSVINHAGTSRSNEFSRINEYIFIVMLGDVVIESLSTNEKRGENVLWDSLRRHNPNNIRDKQHPNQFYPIYVNDETKKIQEIGAPIPFGVSIHTIPDKEGCSTVWPIKENGVEMMWGVMPSELQSRLKDGFVRVGNYYPDKPQKYSIQFLSKGTINDIKNGVALVSGYLEDGSVIAYYPGGKKMMPTNQWDIASHDARDYGTKVIRSIFGHLRFTYPKSLYAVHDTVRFFVYNKPNALVLDFFAGSGTTLHAVNLLNAEDGGHRRCIMVTNNEVSADEAKALLSKGFQPGDDEWDRLGIARYVTWPRTVCSIKGIDVNGNPLKGKYLGGDILMSDGFKANAAFFKLGFLDKKEVELGRQFCNLLPVLWMKAGAVGPCPSLQEDGIPGYLVLPENRMAILIKETEYAEFSRELSGRGNIDVVYIVTDSDSDYRSMIAGLGIDTTYQIYRDYLDNFRININR